MSHKDTGIACRTVWSGDRTRYRNRSLVCCSRPNIVIFSSSVAIAAAQTDGSLTDLTTTVLDTTYPSNEKPITAWFHKLLTDKGQDRKLARAMYGVIYVFI